MSIFLNLFRRNSVPASQNLLSNQRQDDESSQSESEFKIRVKVSIFRAWIIKNFIEDDNNYIYFNNFIKDKPVKKQKLEHGKHAAQDQEKENGF